MPSSYDKESVRVNVGHNKKGRSVTWYGVDVRQMLNLGQRLDCGMTPNVDRTVGPIRELIR